MPAQPPCTPLLKTRRKGHRSGWSLGVPMVVSIPFARYASSPIPALDPAFRTKDRSSTARKILSRVRLQQWWLLLHLVDTIALEHPTNTLSTPDETFPVAPRLVLTPSSLPATTRLLPALPTTAARTLPTLSFPKPIPRTHELSRHFDHIVAANVAVVERPGGCGHPGPC